jgi:glyoxylase-like metal-dependent hydrolase (beta-lactamase superfamily II)
MNETIQRIELGFVNAYLVETPLGFVLVDAGVPSSWDRLKAALDAAGCTPGRLSLVLLTHGDMDHVGCARRLREEYGAPVAVHPGDRGMVESGEDQNRRGSNLAIRMAMRFRPHRRDPDAPYLSPDVLLEDGQSLAAYGWDARVVHCPGHTVGSVAILTSSGDLIVGDTASNMTRPGPGMLVQNAAEYNRTLAMLAALPAKTVFPGHGRPFPHDRMPRRL